MAITPRYSSLRQYIEECMEQRKKHYAEDANRIVEDFNKEDHTVEQYNGRQLLEMLQNADDAASKAFKGRALIQLRGNTLTIANTGEPFTKGGMISILYSDLSPKFKQQNKIGAKGLGFRALLSWAEQLEITSHDLHVRFSAGFAKQTLRELLKATPGLKAQLRNLSNNPAPIAVLRCADLQPPVPKARQKANGYDTTITVQLKPGIAAQVRKQMERDIDPELMVFTNNLEEVVVDTGEQRQILSRRVEPDGRVAVSIQDNNSAPATERTWQVLAKIGRHESGKNFELKVAWQQDLTDQKNFLYSFFRTSVRFPFPVLVHGTFELTPDRNHLEDDTTGHNRFLVPKLATLLLDAAQLIALQNKPANYTALRLLRPTETLDPQLVEFGFEEALLEGYNKQKLFPALNGKYLLASEAVFYVQPFAEYLNARTCPHLLRYGNEVDAEATEELLEELHLNEVYPVEKLMHAVSEARSKLSAIRYAELLKLMLGREDVKHELEQEPTGLPVFFYDAQGRDLDPCFPVFLPSTNTSYELPTTLKTQIMSPVLVKALYRVFGTENALNLSKRLVGLPVKPYEFTQVAAHLVKSYSKQPKKLHSFLFLLYSEEKKAKGSPADLPADVTVPVVTLTGRTQSVHETYFGEAYGNTICQNLYHYDLNRIAAPFPEQGLGKATLEQALGYLQWCGVAHTPRINHQEISEYSYKKYVLQKFDYGAETIDGNLFSSYRQLKEDLNGIRTCSAQAVDDLVSILLNNPLEQVLAWLKQDAKMARILVKPEEDSISFLKLDIKRKWYSNEIKGKQMYSYIRWVFENTPWLRVLGQEEKIAPAFVTLAKTVGDAFRPLIYKPDVDYDRLAKKPWPGLSKREVDGLLVTTGVHNDISSFSTASIYEMLSQLPVIDKSGSIARSIYREIVENYELADLDKEDAAYQKFCREGSMLSVSATGTKYVPVGSTYYIDNKSYGEDLVRQFDTIAVDRRRGSQRVKELFGVSPLVDLKLGLAESPLTHPLQAEFEAEFVHLLPFVYALRRKNDPKNTSRDKLKNLRPALASDIRGQYQVGVQTKDFTLGNFEILYLTESNRAFIEVPETLTTMESLKDSAALCDAVAEVICTALGVDENKAVYEYLFSSSRSKRKAIIEARLDGQTHSELEHSKAELNQSTQAKQGFWQTLLATLGQPLPNEAEPSDEVWRSHLTRVFPLPLAEQACGLFQEISFAEQLTVSELSRLRDFLLVSGVLLSVFNEKAIQELEFRPLYDQQLKKLRTNLERPFREALYLYLRDKPIEQQRRYLQQLAVYRKFLPTPPNELAFEAEGFLAEAVLNTFGVKIKPASELLDLESIVRQTKKDLQGFAASHHIPESFTKEFLEKLSNSSLLYFGCISQLQKQLRHEFKGPKPGPGHAPPGVIKSHLQFGNSTLTYTDFADLAEQLNTSWSPPSTSFEAINTHRVSTSANSGHSSGGGSGGRHGGRQAEENSEVGFLGEYCVYRMLKETCAEVEWLSENGRKANVDNSGSSSEGYDMRYKKAGQDWVYVEVKASTGNLSSFFLSLGELRFGEQHREAYEIILVSNAKDPATQRMEVFEAPFVYSETDSFFNNTRFSVEEDRFHIRFERASH